jgi:hypothetical protein
MLFKKSALSVAAVGILWLSACQSPPQPHRVEVGPGNPDTPAGKAGKLAFKVEKETEKIGKEVGRKIDQAGRDAHAGYTTADKDRSNKQ